MAQPNIIVHRKGDSICKGEGPEAEEYFKSAQKMAADSSVPAEVRELGRVLQRIMIGDRNADLSRLPDELADLIRKELSK